MLQDINVLLGSVKVVKYVLKSTGCHYFNKLKNTNLCFKTLYAHQESETAEQCL